VNLTEGEKYTVSKVDLSGTLIAPRPELDKLVQLKAGDVFSREKLTASTKAIADRLGNEGYAFANANAIPEVDKEKRTVAFNINSGTVNRVYSLSYLDPYYTVNGVSQGFDVYKRKTNATTLAVGPYATDALGGGIKFGYPVSEVSRIDLGVNFEDVNLTVFD